MTNVSAVSAASKGTTTIPVGYEKSEFVTLTRKGGAKINVLNTLFKKYEQAKDIEGVDKIELKNGVVINVLESTSTGILNIVGCTFISETDPTGKKKIQFTDLDGKDMKIEINARNDKEDGIQVSNKLQVFADIDEKDNITNGDLYVQSTR